jgi:hypothetical protein
MQVSATQGGDGEERRPGRTPHIARAELVLAGDASRWLRRLPLKPDPLQQVAAAVSDVRPELGERVEVCVDLLPLTPARVAHLRRRAAAAARQERGALGGLLSTLTAEAGAFAMEVADEFVPGRSPRPSTPVAEVPGRRPVDSEAAPKFADLGEPVFDVQVLIRSPRSTPGGQRTTGARQGSTWASSMWGRTGGRGGAASTAGCVPGCSGRAGTTC